MSEINIPIKLPGKEELASAAKQVDALGDSAEKAWKQFEKATAEMEELAKAGAKAADVFIEPTAKLDALFDMITAKAEKLKALQSEMEIDHTPKTGDAADMLMGVGGMDAWKKERASYAQWASMYSKERPATAIAGGLATSAEGWNAVTNPTAPTESGEGQGERQDGTGAPIHGAAVAMTSLRNATSQLTAQVPETQQALNLLSSSLSPVTLGIGAAAVGVGLFIKRWLELKDALNNSPQFCRTAADAIISIRDAMRIAALEALAYERSLEMLETRIRSISDAQRDQAEIRIQLAAAEEELEKKRTELAKIKNNQSGESEATIARRNLVLEDSERFRREKHERELAKAKLSNMDETHAKEEVRKGVLHTTIKELTTKELDQRKDLMTRDSRLKGSETNFAAFQQERDSLLKEHAFLTDQKYFAELKGREGKRTGGITDGPMGPHVQVDPISFIQQKKEQTELSLFRRFDLLEKWIPKQKASIDKQKVGITSAQDEHSKTNEKLTEAKSLLAPLIEADRVYTVNREKLNKELLIQVNALHKQNQIQAIIERRQLAGGKFKKSPFGNQMQMEADYMEMAGLTGIDMEGRINGREQTLPNDNPAWENVSGTRRKWRPKYTAAPVLTQPLPIIPVPTSHISQTKVEEEQRKFTEEAQRSILGIASGFAEGQKQMALITQRALGQIKVDNAIMINGLWLEIKKVEQQAKDAKTH